MLAHGHQRHRHQEEQQTGREDGLGRVNEWKTLGEIAVFGHLAFAGQITDCVECTEEEQPTGDAQKIQPRFIQVQPAQARGFVPGYPAGKGQAEVEHGRGDQQPPAHRSRCKRGPAGPEKRNQEKQNKHGGSTFQPG